MSKALPPRSMTMRPPCASCDHGLTSEHRDPKSTQRSVHLEGDSVLAAAMDTMW